MVKALTVCVQYKDTRQRASQSVSRWCVCLVLPIWGQSKSRAYQGDPTSSQRDGVKRYIYSVLCVAQVFWWCS